MRTVSSSNSTSMLRVRSRDRCCEFGLEIDVANSIVDIDVVNSISTSMLLSIDVVRVIWPNRSAKFDLVKSFLTSISCHEVGDKRKNVNPGVTISIPGAGGEIGAHFICAHA